MLRYAMAPRWIPLHLITLLVVGVFVRLGWWQWQVAVDPGENGSGGGWDLQNGFYAVQWWVFAGVAVFFWWRFLKDERAEEQRYAEELAAYEAAVRARDEAAARADGSAAGSAMSDPVADSGDADAEG